MNLFFGSSRKKAEPRHAAGLYTEKDHDPSVRKLWGFTPEIFGQLRSGLQTFAQKYGEGNDAELCLPELESAPDRTLPGAPPP